ncbi:uncharacterized protein LOC120111159 [Phoenix dactylifera]|uniref:Uncharacterized protein LOC120111159 n=1 Tax=Phoenix dactylifera TaxID=42345 RepID=A0A8B9AK32_PHODC|nr:uncharacterized protein LOC120111159 [Phoenix dactylifera]
MEVNHISYSHPPCSSDSNPNPRILLPRHGDFRCSPVPSGFSGLSHLSRSRLLSLRVVKLIRIRCISSSLHSSNASAVAEKPSTSLKTGKWQWKFDGNSVNIYYEEHEGKSAASAKNILMVPTISDVSSMEEWRTVAKDIVSFMHAPDSPLTPSAGWEDTLVVSTANAPKRSKAKMDDLKEAKGVAVFVEVPGALLPQEEYPFTVAKELHKFLQKSFAARS